ncbi:MAG TPA: tyrosine--tRNA ligase [Candidatus Baltobacteraceae bacterium]|nr:tyrosine--tRNA ligase [Candidatus Baltobacteraceae bacterium]
MAAGKGHDRLSLATRNTAEVLTLEELKSALEGKKGLSAYYGTAPTGPVHLGYFVPLGKVFDFHAAGIETKILLADVHASLDDQKTKWDQHEAKVEYYRKCIELALPWKGKPDFVVGSSYQFERKYVFDLLRASSIVTEKRAMRAASEVTRMKDTKVSELIYPIMQALDEQYLDVDIQLGGIDQRHVFALARDIHPLLGYKSRMEIMTPVILSLRGDGKKMSASEPNGHIKIYDSEEAIKKKIDGANCPVGQAEANPVLELVRYILFPIVGKLEIHRDSKYGGDASFDSYESLQSAFVEKKLHPMDLKKAVALSFINMLKPARDYFSSNIDMLKQLGPEFMP